MSQYLHPSSTPANPPPIRASLATYAVTGPHDPADCPVCQDALRPTEATAAGRTWPVVDMPGLDPWLRRIEADDAPETGPVAAHRPWLARGDNHPAGDAGEGQSRRGVPHTHREIVPGCFRCELYLDEVASAQRADAEDAPTADDAGEGQS